MLTMSIAKALDMCYFELFDTVLLDHMKDIIKWWHVVYFIFLKMISTAGAKEAELRGASSVVRGKAVVEAIQGET